MTLVALAGATGDLGTRVATELRALGAEVRALVRPSADIAAVARLEGLGCEVRVADLGDAGALAGADVVLSTLSGLRDVIVDGQARLLDAAVRAGVPRFIPSDFAVDFRGHEPGTNRNLDLRREFMGRLDAAPIRATSVLCGMFMDLLNGPAPMVIHPIRRVVHWGRKDQRLDFTTIADTAAFTARAAMDAEAPRWLRIAGHSTDASGVAAAASVARGHRYRTLRTGSTKTLARIIKVVRRLSPAEDEVFPAWQGMQYFHSMFEGGVAFRDPLDNDRYGARPWTRLEELLRPQPASR